MRGELPKRSAKAGLPPGSLIHIGRKREGAVSIRLLAYNNGGAVEEQECTDVRECRLAEEEGAVNWLSVGGVHDAGVIEAVGEAFHLHPLLLEDIMNTDQRPKFEDYGDYVFVVVKRLSPDGADRMMQVEQVGMVLGKNYVITFEEGSEEAFESVRERIRSGRGRLRAMGPDYLLYALIDTVVDGYFAVMENLGERVEVLEETLVVRPGQATLRSIHDLKREVIYLRRSVWPLREVIAGLQREATCLVSDRMSVYLRDVYDHVVQIMDAVETYRDMLSGMLDIYLSSVSNRLNEVMKVLTFIATIFIPLTFIAGVYGMNFKHMPELDLSWGYPAVLLLMVAVTLAMVFYFKRKKWF